MKTGGLSKNRNKTTNKKNRTRRRKMRGMKRGGEGRSLGLVYILSNKSYKDVYLIGERKETNIEKLLADYDSEWTPYPFELQYSVVIENSKNVFNKLCEKLTRNHHREKPDKDFFRCNAATLNEIRTDLNKELTKDLAVIDDVRMDIGKFI